MAGKRGAQGVIVGIGVDLVAIRRLAGMLERHGRRLLDRCFVSGEVERPSDPAHVAPLLAAKEAAFKALGTGWGSGVTWHDVVVTRDDDGTHRLALHGAAERRATELGVSKTHLTLAQEGDMATAIVLFEGSSGPRKP